MTDFSAAFGIWQMSEVESWYEKRKLLFQKYQDNFKNIPE